MLKSFLALAFNFTILTSFAMANSSKQLKSYFTDYSIEFPYGYLHLIPNYETDMDPERRISLDFFYGNIDLDSTSKNGIKLALKKLSDTEREQLKIIIHSSSELNKAEKESYSHLTSELGLSNRELKIEKVPSLVQKERAPSSIRFNPGRKTWTLVRGISSASGPYAALYFGLEEDALTSFNIAIWAGIFSGAATYFSGPLDKWTTSEGMAHWLLESPNKRASAFRKIFGLNSVAFHEALIRNVDMIKKNYPKTYSENQKYFNQQALKETKAKLKDLEKDGRQLKFLSMVRMPEEYLKWYITEFAFNALALEIPRYVAGLTNYTHLGDAFTTLAGVSAWGLIAQAPADLAITKIKFKEVHKLKDDIISRKIEIDDSPELLKEIEKVLAKDGVHADYSINDKSHRLLQNIENKARMKATILSFLSVTGVALKLMSDDSEFAGTIAEPYLQILATSGALYFAYANDWLTPKLLNKLKTKISMSKLSFLHRSLPKKICLIPYRN